MTSLRPNLSGFRVVDLSVGITPGMPVYPGDPPVSFEAAATLGTHGYRVTRLSLGTHTGTHVDAPAHLVDRGLTLDQLSLARFVVWAQVIRGPAELGRLAVSGDDGLWGLVLGFKPIARDMRAILKRRPSLLGFTARTEPPLRQLREALAHEVLTLGPLVRIGTLRTPFLLCAAPLALWKGDGSPVRAMAVIPRKPQPPRRKGASRTTPGRPASSDGLRGGKRARR